MGNKASSMLQDEEITIISEETGFSAVQIERLYSRFKSLDKSGICGSLSRQDFLQIPELAINPLCDRIVDMFFVDCDEDHERINFRQFMKVLATFRSSPTGGAASAHANPTPSPTSSSSQTYHNNNNNNSLMANNSRNSSRKVSRNELHTHFHHYRHNKPGSINEILDSFTQNLASDSRHDPRNSSCDTIYSTTNQHSIHYVGSSSHLNSNHHHHHQHLLFSANHEEPANSERQKLLFMFKIYDVDNDDLIGLQDIIEILKMMTGTYLGEARVRRIAERNLKEADKNCDGFIDFDEFCTIFTETSPLHAIK